MAPGSWRYTVTPLKQNWVGGESAKSATATVNAPSLTFSSSTTIDSLPRTLSGSVASYLPGETITFRLDNPTSGTVLTGSTTPSPIGSSGSATLSVTIPAGTSNGSHTVYAVGSGGSTASASILVDTVAPSVTAAAIAKTQGGTAGFIKQGGTYYVYANVTDGGSGVATATANVSTVTTGQTAAALSSGSFTVGGVTYNYRSAQLTANATLTAGAKAFYGHRSRQRRQQRHAERLLGHGRQHRTDRLERPDDERRRRDDGHGRDRRHDHAHLQRDRWTPTRS